MIKQTGYASPLCWKYYGVGRETDLEWNVGTTCAFMTIVGPKFEIETINQLKLTSSNQNLGRNNIFSI
jgi:alpha-L-arabinofuranosidase